MVNKIKKAAQVAKTIITHKSASNGAEKSSAATQVNTIPMPVVEERVTNLILKTKNGMKDLDVLHGKSTLVSDDRFSYLSSLFDFVNHTL